MRTDDQFRSDACPWRHRSLCPGSGRAPSHRI